VSEETSVVGNQGEGGDLERWKDRVCKKPGSGPDMNPTFDEAAFYLGLCAFQRKGNAIGGDASYD